MTISDIAKELEITQSGVSQMLATLEKKGVVQIEKSSKDRRVKTATLTKDGYVLLDSIKPIWKAIKLSMYEMINEGEHSRYMLTAFDELEETMTSRSLLHRVQDKLRKLAVLDNLSFSEFNPQHEASFKNLLLSWLSSGPILPKKFDWINGTREELESGKSAIIVVEHADSIVGVAIASIDKSLGRSDLHLVVEDEWKSEELLQVLLGHIVADLKEKGVREIVTRIEVQNTMTIKVLKDNSFVLDTIETESSNNISCMVLSRKVHGG